MRLLVVAFLFRACSLDLDKQCSSITQSAQQPWRVTPAVSTSGRCRDSRELAGSAVVQSVFTQVRSHCSPTALSLRSLALWRFGWQAYAVTAC